LNKMAVDISQFHEMFFEECADGLETMETGLLHLSSNGENIEIINDIFRAAHSIKGGAGTFGFQGITEFTHDLETLLDLVREGKREITSEMTEVMLKSVDCLRVMLSELKNKQSPDYSEAQKITVELKRILDQGAKLPAEHNSNTSELTDKTSKNNSVWHIKFRPHPEMLKSGNEPYRIIKELSELGTLKTTVNTDDLLEYDKIDITECYISWEFFLEGSHVDKDKLEDVFEWVIDESDVVLFQIDVVDENNLSDALAEHEELKEPIINSIDSVDFDITNHNPVLRLDTKADNQKSTDSKSIRVNIETVDALINMVGEMVITQSMLSQLSKELSSDRYHDVIAGLAQLAANTRELQETVMSLRMMPISFAFNRFPRLIRDLGNQLNKKVNLIIAGEQTELDKTVMEKLSDPLTHLIRNAMDHGMETTEERRACGKPEEGSIELKAYYEGGSVVIKVSDDGRGLNVDKIRRKAISAGIIREDDILSNEEIQELILRPGFSTADQISDLSGRGVGLDVVKQNIRELNGSLDLMSTPMHGTSFTIRLPLTLAIVEGQLIRVKDSIYVIPLISISESLQMDVSRINCIAGGMDLYRLRNDNIPVVYLEKIFNHPSADSDQASQSMMIVVESNDKKLGLVVDELLDQQQVVIKSLETNYQSVKGISGATILGDGTVAMICDIHDIFTMSIMSITKVDNVFELESLSGISKAA